MKTIKFLGLTILASLSLVACQEKLAEREPSPKHDAPSIFFAQSEITKEYDPAQEINTDSLTICRKDAAGALEVAINVLENTDDIFTVPEKIEFEDGVTEVKFAISGFLAGEAGKKYTLKLSVDEKVINPYSEKLSVVTYSVTNLAWVKSETQMVYEDGAFMAAFGVDYIPFYADFEYIELPDGSLKFRVHNPFASMATEDADRYGVYNGYPYNGEGEFDPDPEADHNVVISIDANGTASMAPCSIGVDWSYGEFGMGNVYGNLSTNIESYPLGTYDKKTKTVVFPDNSLYLYLPTNGYYVGKKTTLYFDVKVYQDDHSVKHIADLEGKFNDPSIEWDTIPGGTSILQSGAFEFLGDRLLLKAHNMDEAAGENSEFLNLYMVADTYVEGYGLAFYWDQEKNRISVPEQETGVSITSTTKVLVKDNGSVVTDSTLVGVDVTAFVFNLKFITDAQGEIGDFTEYFFIGEEEIKFSKESYIGWWDFNCNLSGADAVVPTLFSDGENDTIWIDGINGTFPLYALYVEEDATIVLPQQIMDILDLSAYGLTSEEQTVLVSYDYSGNPIGEDIILKLGLSGNIELVDNGLVGFYQWVNNANAYWDYWDIYSFTPGEAPVSAPHKAAHHGLNTSLTKEHKAQPS
ncbi:MAG: hypothetical protein MJZ58_01880, partial [Paludibacteraceae bacterium]|nr:hypothetical protein [Paludibacteraceae bacterium]